jgi:hypothetical protein
VVRQAEQVILAVVAVVAVVVVVVVVRAVREALASSLQFHQKATVCAVAFFFPIEYGVLQSIGILRCEAECTTCFHSSIKLFTRRPQLPQEWQRNA